MSASLGLFRLQQVDRQIDRVRAQLDTIRRTLENDAELRKATERLETTQDRHQRAAHALQVAEAKTEALKIKLTQVEASLYSGAIKNPKELQDLEREIASLKKYLASLEERQWEAMLAAEEVEKELKQAWADLEALKSRLGNEQATLLEEQSALKNQLERLAQEREATLAPIDSALLQTYETLREQKGGVAVAEISDSACAACGAMLNPAIQQSARSQKQLIHCPNCGRILFAN